MPLHLRRRPTQRSSATPRLPYGWRRDGPISLSLLLHYGKAWRSSSLRELDPSRSPQTLQYLCSSVLSAHFHK